MSDKPTYEELAQRIRELEKVGSASKRAEEALEQKMRELKTFVDNIPHMAWLKDADSNFILANQAFGDAVGMDPEYLRNHTCAVCFGEEAAKKFKDDDRKVMRGRKRVTLEEAIMDDNGNKIYLETTKSPIFNEAGGVVGTVGIAINVTDRKQAEAERKKLQDQLNQALKMEAIGSLAGGIAHDFNNLLSVISGSASIMLIDLNAAHPNYELLKGVEKEVRRGARLTDQLLGYARKGRYDVKSTNLNELIKDTTYTLARTRKELTIDQDLAEDLFVMEADESQIEQVLLNLYTNAADAMPGGGGLFLKTINLTHQEMKGKLYNTKPGKYVLLTVRDTGMGMDPETLGRIFDPFFTTKQIGKGTGLGLASAYGIVKGHGGYIDVESEKGKGTTFSIYLPATEKKIEKIVPLTKHIIEGSGTILLVDDEQSVLMVGTQILKRFGYTVLEAEGGREAVKIYKENKRRIDLVILDMIMPYMGGGQVYDRIKEIDPDVKVLLSSGYSIDGQATELLARGCNAFIQKPFSMEDLSQAVKGIMGKG